LCNVSCGSHVNDRISHPPSTFVLITRPHFGPRNLWPFLRVSAVTASPSLLVAGFENVEDRKKRRLPLPVSASHGFDF